MKLIIQIPAHNEAGSLARVLKDLPPKIAGIKKIEVVVIDDGSTDRTAAIARRYGATVISLGRHLGLGAAFRRGQQYALARRVDILVNTDGDHQYPGQQISRLVRPIIKHQAELVIGNRRPWQIARFSLLKRTFQYLGSQVVSMLAGVKVPDAVSGFRAYHREALEDLHLTTRFSYTLDSLIQLAKKGHRIISVSIRTHPPARPSRLANSLAKYLYHSGMSIMRLYVVYEPFRTFLALALLLFLPGIFLCLRFVSFYLNGRGGGHIQSLIAAAILITVSVVLFSLGIIAEMLKTNRTLIERQQNKP